MKSPRAAASGPPACALVFALLSLVALLLGCAVGIAPSPPAVVANPPASPVETVSPPAATDLSSHAAVIFSGTVLSVEPVPAPPDGVGTIRVRFRVDEGFRGVQAGELFTLTEWQGLWTSGDRYRVGQPLLLYLYAPSASGLASPVSGYAGLISLAPSGSTLEAGGWAATLDPAEPPQPPAKLPAVLRNLRQVSPE